MDNRLKWKASCEDHGNMRWRGSRETQTTSKSDWVAYHCCYTTRTGVLMFYSELSSIRNQSGSFFIVWGVLSLPGHYPFLSSFSDIYIWRLVPKTSRINNCGSVQCRDVWWRRWLIWKRERLFVKPSRWRHPFKPWRRRNRWVMDTLDWVCKSEYNYLLSCCCISRMLYERVDVQDQKDATCSTHAHTHTRSHAHNTQMDLF